jgi:hypothetical protein
MPRRRSRSSGAESPTASSRRYPRPTAGGPSDRGGRSAAPAELTRRVASPRPPRRLNPGTTLRRNGCGRLDRRLHGARFDKAKEKRSRASPARPQRTRFERLRLPLAHARSGPRSRRHRPRDRLPPCSCTRPSERRFVALACNVAPVGDCWHATVASGDPLLGHEIVPGSLPLLVQLASERAIKRGAGDGSFRQGAAVSRCASARRPVRASPGPQSRRSEPGDSGSATDPRRKSIPTVELHGGCCVKRLLSGGFKPRSCVSASADRFGGEQPVAWRGWRVPLMTALASWRAVAL